MSARVVRILGALLLLGYLAVLLATDDIGVGEQENGADRWPYVFEDPYDRGAYQMRGRWLPAHATPYLEEFSEYPQLTTWYLGLPYLIFDHGVEPGSPFETLKRSRATLLELGVPGDGIDIAFELFEDEPYGAGEYSGAAGKLMQSFLERLRTRAGPRYEEGRLALDAAWQAQSNRTEELKRNRVGYGRSYQVVILIWYLLLLLVTVELLLLFGRPPVWALLLCLPAGLYYGFNRSDLPMMGMLAAAFLLQFRDRRLWAAMALGVAIMVKWAPLALVPLFLSYNFHTARERERVAGRSSGVVPLLLREVLLPGAVIGTVILAVLSVTFLWNGGGLEAVWFVVDWHLHTREPNHSAWLSLVTHPDRLGWFEMADRAWLSKVGLFMQFAPAFALALLPIKSRDSLVRVAIAALIGTVLFSKFFSPQWVVWIGFLCALLASRQLIYAALFALANLTVYIQLPILWYPAISGGDPDLFWGWTYWRVALLLAFWAFAIFDFVRRVRSDVDPPFASLGPGAQSAPLTAASP
jgi:hypothetical protein